MSQVEKVGPLAAMKEAAEDVVSGDVGLRLLRAAEAVAELVAAARGELKACDDAACNDVAAERLRAALRPFPGERA